MVYLGGAGVSSAKIFYKREVYREKFSARRGV